MSDSPSAPKSGRPPAVVIIARHGARLDAADKTWHLTSPTPYDPPLTYGGWSQSKTLGTRIASVLHARERESSSASPSRSNSVHELDRSHSDRIGGSKPLPGQTTTKKKHKVVIHSSPFLRCVQTSIAISAGIAQYDDTPPSSRSASPKRKSSLGRVHERSPSLKAIPEPEDNPTRNVLSKSLKKQEFAKTTLRVDAFLGEWLSPDYFDLITPPPNSTMMVAGAKADLLRRGEYIDVRPNSSSGPVAGNFPGGWHKATGSTSAVDIEGSGLSNLGSLTQALPTRDRASSYSNGSSAYKTARKGDATIPASTKPDSGGYRAPVPTYAISPAEPIPRGYVAHARDACVDVDYQWDSMREPQHWGDGGEYGEEWSAMHKRFRRGLNNMISWYQTHGAACHPDDAVVDHRQEEYDEDTELVLVLVTHGAGCNALIGALTNQPVLLDVGMASLTMAERKEIPDNAISDGSLSPSEEHRRSLMDLGLQDEYSMRFVASTEHLRVGADPARGVPPIATGIADSRRRYGAHAAAGSPIENVGEPIGKSMNSSLGSMRRSNTFSAVTSRSYSASPSAPSSPSLGPKGGLWSKATPSSPPALDGASSPGTWSPKGPSTPRAQSPVNDMMFRYSEAEKRKSSDEAVKEAEDDVAPLPPPPIGRSMSQAGLWGSAPTGARTERERGPKRRWTVSERDA